MSDSDDSSIDCLTNDDLLKKLLKNRSNVRIQKCLYEDQHVEHIFNVKLMDKSSTNDSDEEFTKKSVNKSPRETMNAPTQVPIVEIMLPGKAAKTSIPRKVETPSGSGLNKPMTPLQIFKHSRFDRLKLNNFSTPKQPNKLCTFTCPVSPIIKEVKSSTTVTPLFVENSPVKYINDNRKSEFCCVHNQTRMPLNQKPKKSEYMSFGSLPRRSSNGVPHNNITNKKIVSMSISNERRLSDSSISSDSSVEIPNINNETAIQMHRSFDGVCLLPRVLKPSSSNLRDTLTGCSKMNLTISESEIDEIQHDENKENSAILSESILTQESLRLSSQMELDVTDNKIESDVEKFQNANKENDNLLASTTKENVSNTEIESRNDNSQQIGGFTSIEPITNDKFNLDVPAEKSVSEEVRNLNANMEDCSVENLAEREMNNINAEPNNANTKTNLIKRKSSKKRRRLKIPIKKISKRSTSRNVKLTHLSSAMRNEPESKSTQESLRIPSRMEFDVTDINIESDVENFQKTNKENDNLLASTTKENVSNEIGSRGDNLPQIDGFTSESLLNRKDKQSAEALGAISRLQEGGLKSNSELCEPVISGKFNLDVPEEKGVSEEVRNLNANMQDCSAEDLAEREINNSNAKPNNANTKKKLIKGKSSKTKRSKRCATPIKKTLRRNTSRKVKLAHLSSERRNEPESKSTQESLRISSRMELDVTEQIHKDNTVHGNKVYVDQIESDVEKFQNASKENDNLLASTTKENVSNTEIESRNDNSQQIGEFTSIEPITNDKFNLDVPVEKSVSEEVRNLNANMQDCSVENLAEREMNNSNAEPNNANTKTNLIKRKLSKKRQRLTIPIMKISKRSTSRNVKLTHLSSAMRNEPESKSTQESLRIPSRMEFDVTDINIESDVENFQKTNKENDNLLASTTKENVSNEIGSRGDNLPQIGGFTSESLLNRKDKQSAEALSAISRLQEGGLKSNSELCEPVISGKFNLDVPEKKGVSEEVRNLNANMPDYSAEDLAEREINNSNAEPSNANTKKKLIKGKSSKTKRSKRCATPIKKTLRRNTSRKFKLAHLSSERRNEPESKSTQESLRISSRMELDVTEQIHKDNTAHGNKVYVDQIESDVDKFQNASKENDNLLASTTKENVSNTEIESRNDNSQQIGEFTSIEPITNDKFNLDVPAEKSVSEEVRNLNANMQDCSVENLAEREMNNSNAEPNNANTKTNLVREKSSKVKRPKRLAMPIKKISKRNRSEDNADKVYEDQIESEVEKFQNDNLLASVTKENVLNAEIGNMNDNPARELDAIPRLRTSSRIKKISTPMKKFATKKSSRNVQRVSVTGELNEPLQKSPKLSDRVDLGKTDSLKSNESLLNVPGTVVLRQSVRLIQKKLNIKNSDVNIKPQQKTPRIKPVASNKMSDRTTSERSPPLTEAQVNINSDETSEPSLVVNNTGGRLSTRQKQKNSKTGNETHSKSSKIKCIAIPPHEVQHNQSCQSNSPLSDVNEPSVERPRVNTMSTIEPRRSSRAPKPLLAYWLTGARRYFPVIRDINQLDDTYDSKIPIILLPPNQLTTQSMYNLLNQIKKRMVFKK